MNQKLFQIKTINNPYFLEQNLFIPKVDDCSICLDSLNNKLVKLDCNHLFHFDCIKNITNNSCPLCRREITNLPLCKGCSLCGYFHFNNFKKNGNCIVCGKKSFQYILKNKLYEIEKS